MQYLKQKKKELSFIFICFLVMGLACLLLYQPLMDILKDPQVLRTQLQSYGIGGQLLLIPGEIIEIMAGFIYGPIVGMIICMIGSAVGSSIIYLFVKKCGIRFIDKLIGLDKVNEVEFLKNKEKRNILCFIIFFIPGTPKDIMTYFIPLTDMKLSTFLFITTIARIPSIITSTIGGHAIGVENYIFSIIVFVITAIVSLIGIYIYRKITTKKEIGYNL